MIIPECWKCSSCIRQYTPIGEFLDCLTKMNNNQFTVVGCKDCDKVHNYNDAKKYCPLIEQENKNESKRR